MYVFNQVPPTADESLIKTLAFPFQRGKLGFPAMAQPQNYTYVNIVQLLTTALGERVMNWDLGIDLYEYVFENMTPIQQARLSMAVANVIENFIPGSRVLGVVPEQKKFSQGVGTYIVFNVRYTVNGETQQQQVMYPPTTQGQ